MAQQMIVQKIQVPVGEPVDFRKSLVNCLGVERLTTLEKGILVAKNYSGRDSLW